MNKKTSYIIIFSLLVVLTIGIIFTDYTKQLGTILADASVPNPGHPLSEIEGGQDLATKAYVDTAVAEITQGSVTSVGTGSGLTGGPITSSGTISVDSTVVRTTGDQTIGGNKTFSNTIVGTGIITNASGEARPACDASTRGLMWYEYGSSGNDDSLYICRKTQYDTYAYTTYADITPWQCEGDFIDPRDSNIYPIVAIGSQCWMAKNLAYLPSVTLPKFHASPDNPYYYVYDYYGTDVDEAKATANYATHGVLYNWFAATTACPSGWHLPSDAELHILESYLTATGSCDANRAGAGNLGWGCSPAGTLLKSGGATGFNALLSGFVEYPPAYEGLGGGAYYWSTESSCGSGYKYIRGLGNETGVYRYCAKDDIGASVRCLRD